jgi:hypothetical protein
MALEVDYRYKSGGFGGLIGENELFFKGVKGPSGE